MKIDPTLKEYMLILENSSFLTLNSFELFSSRRHVNEILTDFFLLQLRIVFRWIEGKNFIQNIEVRICSYSKQIDST